MIIYKDGTMELDKEDYKNLPKRGDSSGQMTFTVNYEFNGNDSVITYIAETEEQAKAHLEQRKPGARVFAVSEGVEGYRPGMPCVTVPKGWS